MQKVRRPKYLNLVKIRLPIAGIVSIFHRVSGAALFFGLPILLWGLNELLKNPDAYQAACVCLQNPLVKLVFIGLLWAYMHHLCAGTRFLFLDIHKGLDIKSARITSITVLVVSLSLTALVGALLW